MSECLIQVCSGFVSLEWGRSIRSTWGVNLGRSWNSTIKSIDLLELLWQLFEDLVAYVGKLKDECREFLDGRSRVYDPGFWLIHCEIWFTCQATKANGYLYGQAWIETLPRSAWKRSSIKLVVFKEGRSCLRRIDVCSVHFLISLLKRRCWMQTDWIHLHGINFLYRRLRR